MARLIYVDKLGLTDFEIVMCDGDYKKALKMILNKIDNAPTVDAVPVRHGKWIYGSTLGHSWMKCSECCVSQDGQTLCFSYCPNCGARMDEE